MTESVIKADYFPPRSNQKLAVELSVVDGQVLVCENSSIICSVPLADFKMSSALANLPREAELTDGAKLIVFLGQDITALEGSARQQKQSQFLTNLESHKPLWLASLVLVPVFIYFIVAVLIPMGARTVVAWLPSEVTTQIDNQTLYTLDKAMMAPSQLPLETQARVSALWNETVPKLTFEAVQLKLLFRHSESMKANAFALPGGTIVVTDDLVKLLEDEPNAMLAVLLHEIGHVHHQHGLQLAAESLASSLLLSYVFGDLEGIAEFFSGTALTLIQNGFSRDLEREADRFSTAQLSKLCLPPEAFATAIKKLSESHEGKAYDPGLLDQYFSSHPLADERIDKATQQGSDQH